MPFYLCEDRGKRGRKMWWLIWLLRICLILFALYCFLAAPNLFHRKLSNHTMNTNRIYCVGTLPVVIGRKCRILN